MKGKGGRKEKQNLRSEELTVQQKPLWASQSSVGREKCPVTGLTTRSSQSAAQTLLLVPGLFQGSGRSKRFHDVIWLFTRIPAGSYGRVMYVQRCKVQFQTNAEADLRMKSNVKGICKTCRAVLLFSICFCYSFRKQLFSLKSNLLNVMGLLFLNELISISKICYNF